MTDHHYAVELAWTGNTGQGTKNLRSYSRDHNVAGDGLPTIAALRDRHSEATRPDGIRTRPTLARRQGQRPGRLAYSRVSPVLGYEITRTVHNPRECGLEIEISAGIVTITADSISVTTVKTL